MMTTPHALLALLALGQGQTGTVVRAGGLNVSVLPELGKIESPAPAKNGFPQVYPGKKFTVRGMNFSLKSSENRIWILKSNGQLVAATPGQPRRDQAGFDLVRKLEYPASASSLLKGTMPELPLGRYAMQVEVAGKGFTTVRSFDLVAEPPPPPTLASASPKIVEMGDSFNVKGSNLPGKAYAFFKRTDGKGTAENGGYGTADASGYYKTERRILLPKNLKPGDFKLKINSADNKMSSNEIDIKVVYEQMSIAVSFISFKCIDETADSGDSDESYFFANAYSGGTEIEHFATKVYENTDSGQTKSESLRLATASPGMITKVGFLLGMGECDNYNWKGDWVYGYHKYYPQIDVDINTWGLMIARGIKTMAYDDCFRPTGKFYNKIRTADELLLTYPFYVGRYMSIFGDELIGYRTFKVSEADVQKALANKGEQPIVKTFKFTGDDSHYVVTLHIRAVPSK